MTKPFDFDAWYDENAAPDKPTRPFRLAGRVWQIPVDVPAASLLRVESMRRRLGELAALPDDADVPAAITDAIEAAQPEPLLRSMVGDGLVDQWVDAGITEHRLGVAAGVLYRHYTGTETLDDLDDPGKPDEDEAVEGGKAPTSSETSSDGSLSTGT